jgi:hypothetical protein
MQVYKPIGGDTDPMPSEFRKKSESIISQFQVYPDYLAYCGKVPQAISPLLLAFCGG